MEPNLGTHGATRQSWSRDSIRQIFREIQAEYPNAGHEQYIRLLRERCLDDSEAMAAAMDYIVTNLLNAQEGYERRNPTPRTPRTPQQAEERRRDADTMTESIKRQIALLNLPMANGKLARNCTGEELIEIGGRWTKVGKKIGRNATLGSVLNEAEVRELWDRA